MIQLPVKKENGKTRESPHEINPLKSSPSPYITSTMTGIAKGKEETLVTDFFFLPRKGQNLCFLCVPPDRNLLYDIKSDTKNAAAVF